MNQKQTLKQRFLLDNELPLINTTHKYQDLKTSSHFLHRVKRLIFETTQILKFGINFTP